LTALEEIALECQRSEMRDRILSWPEFAHLTSADLEAATDEAFRILEEIRRCPRT
jgi:hypothetical protein